MILDLVFFRGGPVKKNTLYYKCDLTATVHDFASEKVLITVNISNVEHVQPERVDEEDCRQQGP